MEVSKTFNVHGMKRFLFYELDRFQVSYIKSESSNKRLRKVAFQFSVSFKYLNNSFMPRYIHML